MTDRRVACSPQRPAASRSLPWGGLLALAASGFLTMLTETIPAGLLPQIGAGLGESPGRAGQLVSVYAAGSMIAAIPLTARTRGMPRRILLLTTIATVGVVNAVTAVSSVFLVSMTGRFIAGMAAGVQWAMLAGYAMRLVDEQRKGRALALSMAGVPLALALGVPLGVFSTELVGWRTVFGVLAGLAAAVGAWLSLSLPEVPGDSVRHRVVVLDVVRLPGIRAILLTALAFELGHMSVYTYVAPVLDRAGFGNRISEMLLLFGFSAIAGLWVTGLLIDRNLRGTALVCLGLFLLVMVGLSAFGTTPMIVVVLIAIWGLALGGAPTLFQAASARAAVGGVDIAQSMLVTVLNFGMAAGGLVGGVTLSTLGVPALPCLGGAVFAAALAAVWCARLHAFPASGHSRHPGQSTAATARQQGK